MLRATADFWVSRADRDSLGRYHIANVVSVAEGLIGVTDDAYTNAVARKNLELATAASRRLGQTPDARWDSVAAGLHLPYDSASDFYRTYEGAPDSTLGDVTPLLVYPLGVSMSASAKRAQVEQAIRSLLAEGPGAMMGSTLLSVDAAELGDRALVDSLLPLSYRGHAKGPFLMLSETPSNNAVNFVTGAGGFLQQVIFGYTGLRFGTQGIEPAFDPVLPSSVSRLILRGIWLKGRRYDVVVDGGGRRIVPWNEGSADDLARAPAGAGAGAGAGRPGSSGARLSGARCGRSGGVPRLPDPLLPRFPAQHGADLPGAAGRADDAGLGRCGQRERRLHRARRRGTPGPARLGWTDAVVSDSAGFRSIEYGLAAKVPSVTLGWVVLGSMRVERDVVYARRHLQPFTAPAFVVQEESLLVAAVRRLPVAEQQAHLALLRARTLDELEARLRPTITAAQSDSGWTVRLVRPALDAGTTMVLELSGSARTSAARSRWIDRSASGAGLGIRCDSGCGS